jgi:hypothetical protein
MQLNKITTLACMLPVQQNLQLEVQSAATLLVTGQTSQGIADIFSSV